MKRLIEDIQQSLEEFADEKRIEFAKKSYPTRMQVIGVSVPNLKIVLKELKKETKLFETKEKLELIKGLVDKEIFELQQIAFEYLQSQKDLYNSLTKGYIESIEKNLDNWLSVDSFAIMIVGCAWRENSIGTEKVEHYLTSDNHWMRRIGVVATVSLNLKAKGGLGDSKRTLAICRKVVDDHHDMIVKALSWALRELSKTDRESVELFLEEYEDRLHKKVLREVRKKLDTGLKN
ncbi:DNA alkylation repair protein [Flagellimonas meridianipacifica]|nr:DNA alkylation repair protein [Allomuricauda pacifica]